MKYVPNWVPISVPGGNISESGFNAYEELALVFAVIIEHIEEMLKRGYKIEEFAYKLGGINLNGYADFFENIAKLRAARRMWYKILRERYGCKDDRACHLRIHYLTSGFTLTRQQPLNNIARAAIQALAGVLGGAQSMGITPFDEALTIPSELAHLTSLQIHHILEEEANVAWVVDPLAGSYFVEKLTNEIEQRAFDYLDNEILKRGGFLKILNSGWLHNELKRKVIEYERKLANGEIRLVGVNVWRVEKELFEYQGFEYPWKGAEVWSDAMRRLNEVRRMRDKDKVEKALNKLKDVLESNENSMPALMEAVESYATVGEIGNVFREVFGIWKCPLTI
jgi:methylmalonyl-CoA mutase N-terminal domain/subunit